jgi:hypothetical protein
VNIGVPETEDAANPVVEAESNDRSLSAEPVKGGRLATSVEVAAKDGTDKMVV